MKALGQKSVLFCLFVCLFVCLFIYLFQGIHIEWFHCIVGMGHRKVRVFTLISRFKNAKKDFLLLHIEKASIIFIIGVKVLPPLRVMT